MDHLDDTHDRFVNDVSYDTNDRFVSDWYEPDRDDFGDDSYPYDRDLPRRLRHQVLVDGRLIDSWTERVEGTRWEHVARQFDAENTCHQELAPIAPRRHPFAEVLDWLEGLVGGPERLDLLDAVVLSAPDRPLIEDPWERDQFDTVEGLLDSVAAAFFADEAQTVLRRALLDVWNDGHDLVLHPKSAPHTAGGICWAVGRANGWFHPFANVRQKDVQRHLWLKTAISSAGSPVIRTLRDLGPRAASSPPDYPDLLALGHPALLTATTRLRLIGWRDKARVARDAQGSHHVESASAMTQGRLGRDHR
ncbi:hypothetical protein [Lapillicoccus sp.]|uniref:hypothetical protein n=1 Tax=Lapillicoccus sp. TaxID=1909287 RepID=UPI0039834BEC